MRGWLAALAALSVGWSASAGAGPRDALFLDLVKERNAAATWAKHIGDDCVWVGNGLNVATRAQVSGMQIDTGKRVEITDFTAHDYGNAAVLTYIVVEHHRSPATGETTVRLRKMDTYLQRDGPLAARGQCRGGRQTGPQGRERGRPALDRLTGTYETLRDGKPVPTKIFRKDARLFAQTQGQEPGELIPSAPRSSSTPRNRRKAARRSVRAGRRRPGNNLDLALGGRRVPREAITRLAGPSGQREFETRAAQPGTVDAHRASIQRNGVVHHRQPDSVTRSRLIGTAAALKNASRDRAPRCPLHRLR